MYIIGKQLQLVEGFQFTLAEHPYVHRMQMAAEEEARKLSRSYYHDFAVFKRVAVVSCEVDMTNVTTTTEVLAEDLSESLAAALRTGKIQGKADLKTLLTKCLARSLHATSKLSEEPKL